jgi:hypothetical protein
MAAPQGTLLPNGRATLFPENNENGAFTPILVTSSGRSGSTMVMQEFATHPDIVISNIYPFEIKLTSYYAALWNVLTAGCHTPTEIETDFGAHSTDDFLVGRNPWNRPDLLEAVGGAGAVRLMQKTFPGKLEYLFRSTIEEYYGILADKNKASARMFAEKSAINEPVRSACRVLFGAVKEIVLVRDPRDYVCSARSFWRTEPDRMFTTMEAELPMLMKIHRKAQADTLFVRYEDLILEAEPTRRRIYDFLQCDANFQPLAISADLVPDNHRTSQSSAASVGRFKVDLDQDTVRACEDRFQPFMRMFGYA